MSSKQNRLLGKPVPSNFNVQRLIPLYEDYQDDIQDNDNSIQLISFDSLLLYPLSVICFWCSWCPASVLAIEQMEKLAADPVLRENVNFIAVNLNDPIKAIRMISEKQWNLAVHVYVNEKDKLRVINSDGGYVLQSVPHAVLVKPGAEHGVVLRNALDFSMSDRDQILALIPNANTE